MYTNDELENMIEEVMNGVEALSPYRLSKIVSACVGYEVIPQVIYSYVRQNFIHASVNTLGKKEISHDECVRWMKKYVVKNYMKKS